jgi:hypothetical protein
MSSSCLSYETIRSIGKWSIPLPTNTEKINTLCIQVAKLESLQEERTEQYRRDLDSYLKKIEAHEATITKQGEKLVALETRTNSIEKGGDRRWQLAPMIITILVAIANVIVTYTKK